jgi:hypothetical protein
MGTGISEKLYKKYLKMIDGYEYVLKPFKFKPSFYCTDGFCAWWDDYYFSYFHWQCRAHARNGGKWFYSSSTWEETYYLRSR